MMVIYMPLGHSCRLINRRHDVEVDDRASKHHGSDSNAHRNAHSHRSPRPPVSCAIEVCPRAIQVGPCANVLVKLPIRFKSSTNSHAYRRATQSDPPRSATRSGPTSMAKDMDGKGHWG